MRISAIIPTYNRPKELARCLDSILTQSFLPTEVIVVDSGNNEETFNATKNKEKSFDEKGISLIYTKNNVDSLTTAKKIGILSSSGDVVSILDDDMTLGKDYYREIVRVYETIPRALGVEGYNQYRGKKRGLLSRIVEAYQRVFLIRINHDSKFRLLPSLGTTYSDRVGIVDCEWLSGPSTFKTDTVRRIGPDENLMKYCWNEDLDISYRVFKKHPGTLFMATAAEYYHEDPQLRRVPKKELFYMAEVYDLYLFYKNILQTPKNKALYAWSRAGRLLLSLGLILSHKDKRCILDLFFAQLYCLRHMGSIIRQDLRFFNKTLVAKS